MNEASQPTTITVRTLLAHFRSTLDQAHQTGQPVIIALRHREPAGVLLGYETWQALTQQQPAHPDTSAWRAELVAEKQHGAELGADLAAALRQVEDLSRDLAAERQRVAELAAELARPQPTGQTWGQATPGWAAAPRETWAGQAWGSATTQEPPPKSGWRQ